VDARPALILKKMGTTKQLLLFMQQPIALQIPPVFPPIAVLLGITLGIILLRIVSWEDERARILMHEHGGVALP
jgi:hypothetical protein